MLDCAVCALPPAATTGVGPMSLLGPDYPARLLNMEGHQWGHQCLTPYPPPPLLPAFPSLWGSTPPPLLVVPPSLLPQCGAECCDVGRVVAGRGVGHLVDCYLQSSRMTAPHCFCCKGDALRLGHCVEPNVEEEGVSVGGKDLPSRTLRAERVKERQELGQVMGMDRQHLLALQHARKTTTISTQTQYSSFKGEAPPYPGPPTGPPPAYFAPHDSYHVVHHGYRPPPLPPAPLTSPLSSPLSSSSPPASNHLVDLSRTSQQSSSDVQNAPLNLSLSNGSNGVSSSSSSLERPSAQPSVITCLSSSASSSSSRESSPGGRVNGGGGTVNGRGSPAACSPPVSDPAIEEHFRRSLGRSYQDSRPKTVPSTTAVANPANVSVTESVDDHFAKALGDSTWKAIQSQNDDAAMDVWDDHFAKALGATTWRRIKAETEHSENINNNNGSSNGYSPSRPSPTSPPASSLSATVAS